MWPVDVLASLCVPALAVLGWPAVRAWRARANEELGAATTFAASLALGLGFVQAGGMLFGFLGWLRAGPLAAWLLMGLAIAAIGWWRQGRPLPHLPRVSAALLVGAALFVPYLLMAAVPPWYRDEMTYHLSLPRAFAAAGRYVQPDDNVFAAFPLGFESIEAVLHAFGRAPDHFAPFDPRLVGAWTALAAALSAIGLARAAGADERLARWAAPLLLAVPTFVEFGTSAYAEPYLVLWASLGLTAILRTCSGAHRALAPAALCAAAAAATKYAGLAVAAFLAVLLAADVLRRDRAGALGALRRLALFCLFAALLACPFYLRNLVQRGNPIFPVAYDLLGGRGWDSARSLGYGATLSDYGPKERAPLDLFLLPLRLFTSSSMRYDFEGSLGPALGLLALAGILLAGLRLVARSAALPRRPLAAAALFALLWSLFWAGTVQQVRYYLVAVPALIALGLGAIAALHSRRPALARALLPIAVIFSIAWCAPLALGLWNRQQTSEWILGRVGRDELLARLLPESYPQARELESLVPESGRVWLVWMRGYTYYLRRPYREDMVFEGWRLEALLDREADPAQARAALARDGITHLIVHHAFFLSDGNADLEPGRTARLRERFAALVRAGVLQPVRAWGPIALYAVPPG